MNVLVRTPARLHLGVIDLEGGLGRLYGSLGLAICEPFFEAVFSTADEGIAAEENIPRECREIIASTAAKLGVRLSVRVRSVLPLHMGLGATTQITLAAGVAASELYGLRMSVDEVARIFGRGRISRIGVEAFKRGGFIVDTARRPGTYPREAVITRVDFPEEWIVVVATPHVGRGLDEAEESRVFQTLKPPPTSHPEKVSRLVLVKLLPALLEKELTEFGETLTEVQRLVGEAFKQVQGDVVRTPESRKALQLFREFGLVGLGQSSWGPTVYGFTDSLKVADSARRAVEEAMPGQVETFGTNACNVGAKVRML